MDPLDRPERWLPFPELVEPGPFTEPYAISDSRGRSVPSPGLVDLKRRVMLVPLAASGRGVARHELGHVAWSPESPPRVCFPLPLLLAVEDARINLGLRNLGLPVDTGRWGRGRVAACAAEEVEVGALGAHLVRSLAAIGTDSEDILRDVRQDLPAPARALVERLVGRVERGLARAARRAGGPVAPFRTARRLAAVVARELRRAGLLHLVPAHVEELLPSNAPRFDWDGRRGGVTGARPGVLRIREAPLVRPWKGPAPRGARRFVASPVGLRLGRVQRWYTDRAVFRRPVTAGGGSVLVDASGSMHFGLGDLDRILEATRGAALVAMYSGRGARGELRIVARGGLRTTRAHLEPFGGGNVVDLPALRWLARQARPRVWISDGFVTGAGDEPCAALDRRCEAVARRAVIHRVEDVSEAVQILRRVGRGRGGGTRSGAGAGGRRRRAVRAAADRDRKRMLRALRREIEGR